MKKEKLLQEDNELEAQDLDLEVSEVGDIDERIILLADFLDVDPFGIEKANWGSHVYEIVDGEHVNEEWLVLTDDEADEYQREYAQESLDSLGFEQCGLDIKDYIDDDYCEDTMRDMIEQDVSDMTDEEIIDELLEHEIISLNDEEWFKLKDDVDIEDEDFDEDDTSNYELLKDRDDLEQELIDYKEDDDLVQMFWDYGYGDILEEDVDYHLREYHDYPSYINVDRAIDDLIGWADRGADLSGYDEVEEELGTNDEGTTFYGYRQS